MSDNEKHNGSLIQITKREDVCPTKRGTMDLNAVRAEIDEAAKTGPEYWRSLEELAGNPEFQEALKREFPKGASEWIDTVSRRGFLKVMGASLGLAGMTRRVYTYGPETGWGALNMVATIGQVINDLSMFLFILNVGWSLFKGERAGNDPWGAGTLEWSVPSPPPAYNFLALPVVASREPLWSPPREGPTHVSGLSTLGRPWTVRSAGCRGCVLTREPDRAR